MTRRTVSGRTHGRERGSARLAGAPHLALVRDDAHPAMADSALDALRERIVARLGEAGVRLTERELAMLTEAVLEEAVSVAIAWLESA